MSNIPADRRYSKDHEWALTENGVISVGITDYAQHELGDIVFTELPKPGTVVEIGKPMGSIEAVKTVAELFSPVSGEVTEINSEVQNDATIINRDSYGHGWLVRIKPSNIGELDSLLDASAYKKLIEE